MQALRRIFGPGWRAAGRLCPPTPWWREAALVLSEHVDGGGVFSRGASDAADGLVES